MARNAKHDLLTQPAGDIAARQRYVLAFKKRVEQMRRKARVIYDKRIAPDVASQPEGEARDNAILNALYKDDLYQTICTLKLTGQELMWSAISDTVEPAADSLSRRYEALSKSDSRLGSVTLDPELDLPEELKTVHIHLQPGGYLRDEGPTDLLAGAYYEEGGALYSRGQNVGTRESKAECLIRFLGEWKPGFKPARILDMGCSVGASSVPYALAFPDAEVHAIDISPAMLRYGHARAEALGAAVHFHQMDVAHTKFEDNSFDLIVSHNAMHEMSTETQKSMFRESWRLLRPGGICVHQDVPLRFSDLDSYEKAERSFDKWFNGELYWTDYAQNNCKKMFEDAGFDISKGYFGLFEQADKTMKWYLAAVEKPEVNG